MASLLVYVLEKMEPAPTSFVILFEYGKGVIIFADLNTLDIYEPSGMKAVTVVNKICEM